MSSQTWTAPDIARRPEPVAGDERSSLEGWLDYHRETLLGLVRHMAEVERSWFRRRVAGEDAGLIYCTDENPDGDFDDVDTADPGADFATFRAEIEAARGAVEGRDLDSTFVDRHGRTLNVRWAFLHLIEEYARHNGHADLLRERIDGVVGD